MVKPKPVNGNCLCGFFAVSKWNRRHVFIELAAAYGRDEPLCMVTGGGLIMKARVADVVANHVVHPAECRIGNRWLIFQRLGDELASFLGRRVNLCELVDEKAGVLRDSNDFCVFR